MHIAYCYHLPIYNMYRKNSDISPTFEMGLAPCWCAGALRVSVMAAIERHLIRRLGGWRPLRLSMRMLNVGLYTTPPKDRVTGNRNHRDNNGEW